MDLHNSDLKRITDVLSLNIGPEQYNYENRCKTFDPNLSSAAQYSPPPSATSQHSAVVTLYNDNAHNQHASNAVVSTSEISGNCVTYSNIIFVPTHPNDNLDQVVNAIELVKNESETSTNDTLDTHSYRYIVASDQRFLNSLIRANDVETSPHLTGSANTFHERAPSNLIGTVSSIGDNNLILSDISQITEGNDQQLHLSNHPNSNQHTVQLLAEYSSDQGNGSEIFMEDADGQLYRTVQNIYVNNGQTIGSEIIPTIISEPVTFTDIEFTQPNQFDPSAIQQGNVGHDSYREPSNFIENHPVLENAIVYREFKNIKENDETINESIIQNQFHLGDTNMSSYPSHSMSQTDKDQQRILLESTMSPLLAAVNDITARDEQFRSYLTQNKSDNNLEENTITTPITSYYSTANLPITESASMQYTTAKTTKNSTGDASSLALVSTAEHAKSVSYQNHASTSEFVDYSEVFDNKNELLVKPDNDNQDVGGKRKPRKKTTMKRDDDMLVADKFVPSRALATLPTTHLCFKPQIDENGRLTKRLVLAKREIPIRTKFGPFEGIIRSLTKDELVKYKKSSTDFPLLFLNQKSCLDVSNENTSNWMCFVNLARTYREQNLLLCEIESKLYFRSCKIISVKHELRVGYSKEYAEKYNLRELRDEPEKKEESSKSTDWHCSKCKKRFPTIDLLQSHLEYHKLNVTPPKAIQISPVRSTTSKSSESGSPIKSKHRLNTGAIRLRKLTLSKNSRTSGPTVRYACCYCSKVFTKFLSYKKHTNSVHSVDIEHKRFTVDVEHKRLTIEDSNTSASTSRENNMKIVKSRENIENVPVNRDADTEKWLVCQKCQRTFESAEQLEKHNRNKCVKKEIRCDFCMKDFQNLAALIMHEKTHSAQPEIFKCIFCSECFKKTKVMTEHVKIHMKDGTFTCPHCDKKLPEYGAIRKHVKTLHSDVRFRCHECGKDFKSKYKLKDHALTHTEIKQFLCADCGRQFRRKDKLREHILRVHAKVASPKKGQIIKVTAHSSNSAIQLSSTSDKDSSFESEVSFNRETSFETVSDNKSVARARFQPKVPPTEYQRFIYKCHDCMLGFKRRGMLVNHMAKVHPGVRIDSVHELSLPILKTERCYYCLYCDKVYKSSTKRKAHILKYHPGQPLPQSTRGQTEHENANVPNESFSQNIGSVTTRAHQCNWCHKQYASRNRLLQHQRDMHENEVQSTYNQNESEFYRDHNEFSDQHHNQFVSYDMQNQMIDSQPHNMNGFAINQNGIYDHQSHNGFGHSEPENKLLRLSSAALEASIRDDLSFLDASDEIDTKMTQSSGADAMESSSTLPKVDVNFKTSDEFVDTSAHSHCELNPFPQLFEGIDCMSLRPGHFSSINEHNNGDSIGKVDFTN